MLSLHLAINVFSIEQIKTVFLFYILNISRTFSHDKGNFYNLKYLILLLDIKAVSAEYIVVYLSSFYSLIIFLEKVRRRRITRLRYEGF